jgi:hypothetical protein
MNYPYESVTHIHPALANNPNIANVQALQWVHASKAFGTPLDPLAVADAEHTEEVLSGAESEDFFTSPCAELIYWLGRLWCNYEPDHRDGRKPCACFEGNT